jgi:pimeloyl-ACP methyl ester carboxylesterase
MKALSCGFRGLVVGAACAATLAGCLTAPSAPATVKTIDANGMQVTYAERGSGVPIVFVPAAISDYRAWERHVATLARHGYRAVSYTKRYFGTDPWNQNWPPFGLQTHADDLAAFIRALGSGPVHLVGWSYSGTMIVRVALDNPQLVRSAFVFEGVAPATLNDAGERKAFNDDRGAAFKAAMDAVQAGDNAAAARAVIDGVSARQGYFETQIASMQQMQLDNARTLALMFKMPPLDLTCSEVARIERPVAIVRSVATRSSYRIVSDARARCMPRASYVTIPDPGRHGHMLPSGDVRAFTAALVAFIKSQPQ